VAEALCHGGRRLACDGSVESPDQSACLDQDRTGPDRPWRRTG